MYTWCDGDLSISPLKSVERKQILRTFHQNRERESLEFEWENKWEFCVKALLIMFKMVDDNNAMMMMMMIAVSLITSDLVQ